MGAFLFPGQWVTWWGWERLRHLLLFCESSCGVLVGDDLLEFNLFSEQVNNFVDTKIPEYYLSD
jgi:hypothetical protein